MAEQTEQAMREMLVGLVVRVTTFPTRIARTAPIDAECNICEAPVALFDAPTKDGRWAYMCMPCYVAYASLGAASLGCRLRD